MDIKAIYWIVGVRNDRELLTSPDSEPVWMSDDAWLQNTLLMQIIAARLTKLQWKSSIDGVKPGASYTYTDGTEGESIGLSSFVFIFARPANSVL